jgi:hypothetical protein
MGYISRGLFKQPKAGATALAFSFGRHPVRTQGRKAELMQCKECLRETTSRHGYCYRPGRCNAGRLKAIRDERKARQEDQARQIAGLVAVIADLNLNRSGVPRCSY